MEDAPEGDYEFAARMFAEGSTIIDVTRMLMSRYVARSDASVTVSEGPAEQLSRHLIVEIAAEMDARCLAKIFREEKILEGL